MKLMRVVLLPVLIFAGGCETGTEADPNAHIGTYTLVSVDGDGLPADLGVEDGVAISLLSATLNLNADQSAALSLRVRATQGTTSFEVSEALTGTYTRTASSIQVVWDDADPQTFVYDEDEDELTLTSEGHVLVFEK